MIYIMTESNAIRNLYKLFLVQASLSLLPFFLHRLFVVHLLAEGRDALLETILGYVQILCLFRPQPKQ